MRSSDFSTYRDEPHTHEVPPNRERVSHRPCGVYAWNSSPIHSSSCGITWHMHMG
jgi:hypothetical protein